MSVQELEKQVKALPPRELARFSRWFDAYCKTASGKRSADELTEEQKQEILCRRAAYLADPTIATPWEGTGQRLIETLRARRRQKAGSG